MSILSHSGIDFSDELSDVDADYEAWCAEVDAAYECDRDHVDAREAWEAEQEKDLLVKQGFEPFKESLEEFLERTGAVSVGPCGQMFSDGPLPPECPW